MFWTEIFIINKRKINKEWVAYNYATVLFFYFYIYLRSSSKNRIFILEKCSKIFSYNFLKKKGIRFLKSTLSLSNPPPPIFSNKSEMFIFANFFYQRNSTSFYSHSFFITFHWFFFFFRIFFIVIYPVIKNRTTLTNGIQ